MHAGQRVRLIHDPGRVGVLTGKTLARAGTTRWQVQFPEGSDFIPDDQLELVPDSPEHPAYANACSPDGSFGKCTLQYGHDGH
jgi:hypothetical protein